MNPSLFGLAAATLLVALWVLTRRRPRPFLRSDDTSAVAALNRAQLVRRPSPPLASVPEPPSVPTAPVPPPRPSHSPAWPPLPAKGNRREGRRLLVRLAAARRGDLSERLEAVRIARRWGDPSVLPLLRQGLRDVHPEVVREAALALQAYRGRASAPAAPRRVLRTR
jgi:hypothetical protein